MKGGRRGVGVVFVSVVWSVECGGTGVVEVHFRAEVTLCDSLGAVLVVTPSGAPA